MSHNTDYASTKPRLRRPRYPTKSSSPCLPSSFFFLLLRSTFSFSSFSSLLPLPPFRSSSTFYLFGEIYQQFSLFTTNSLVLSRAGIPGHGQEWVLQLIRGRLFIYSRLEERFLPPSKDSPTFQSSRNFDASQKTPFPPRVYVLLKDARLFIGEQRFRLHLLLSPSALSTRRRISRKTLSLDPFSDKGIKGRGIYFEHRWSAVCGDALHCTALHCSLVVCRWYFE